MDSIINTFHIDWKVMLAQAFNFGVVFLVLYFFALKPLAKIMKERTEKIEKGILDAKSNASMLENTKAEYEKALAKARIETDRIFQEGKKEAESKRGQMIEEAKGEVVLIIENGKKSIESEKAKMMREAREEIVTLSVKIAEKVIGAKIDGSFDERTLKELNNV